jgi:hypothetical protein
MEGKNGGEIDPHRAAAAAAAAALLAALLPPLPSAARAPPCSPPPRAPAPPPPRCQRAQRKGGEGEASFFYKRGARAEGGMYGGLTLGLGQRVFLFFLVLDFFIFNLS